MKICDDDHDLFARMAAAEGLALAGVVPFDADLAIAERDTGALGADQGHHARTAIADIPAVVASREEERAALQRMRERVERRIAELQSG